MGALQLDLDKNPELLTESNISNKQAEVMKILRKQGVFGVIGQSIFDHVPGKKWKPLSNLRILKETEWPS